MYSSNVDAATKVIISYIHCCFATGKCLLQLMTYVQLGYSKEATNVNYNTLPPYQSIPEESESRRGVKVRKFRLDGVNI